MRSRVKGMVKNYYTKEVIIRQGNSMYTEGGYSDMMSRERIRKTIID